MSKKRPTNTEKNWRKKFVEKLFFHFIFGLRAEKFEQLNKKFTQDCQNYVQRLQRDTFGTFLWNEGNLLKLFGPRWAKLFDFWRENFGKFEKKQPMCPVEHLKVFWREMYLFERFRSLSQSIRLLEKNFWKGCQKDFSRVLNKTLRKNDKSNLYFYHLFQDFEWAFFDFDKKLVRCFETVT